jgi:hypothetical protein
MAELRESAITLLSSLTLDLDGDASTNIYTVPVGKTCILVYGELEMAGDPNTSDVSIGATAAGTDFVTTIDCNLAAADGDVLRIAPVPSATPDKLKAYATGTVIIAKVTNNAGVAGNTLSLFGFLY